MLYTDSSDRTIGKALLSIALPVIAGTVIEVFYNLTDAFFLGKLGPAQVSAPNIAFSFIIFMIVFGNGFMLAGTTLIAQSKGKKDQGKIDYYLGQMTTYLCVLAVLVAGIGFFLTDTILRLLQTPAEVFGFTSVYMKIVFWGIPFMFGYFVLQGSLQGLGNTKTPLLVHLVSLLLNAVLDPFLIFGIGPFPELGVSGAAIATVISQGAGAIASFLILIRGRAGIRLLSKNMRPSRNSLALFFRIGIPASVGEALSCLGFTVLQGIVNHFGTAVIAAFGVGNRIMGLFDMPSQGMSSAVTTLVGQSLGAKNVRTAKRVVRIALLINASILLVLLTLGFFTGGELVRLFVEDPETVRWGDIMFKVVTPSMFLFGIYYVICGAFHGAGDTKPIMYLGILRLWGIRVPIAAFLAFHTRLGPGGIWVGMFASNFITALLGLLWYRRGSWVRAIDPDAI